MPSSSSSSTTSSANDIKLTASEAKQFDSAFQSEEFRRLMADYVDSLSDPANREQQEAYISELEANKELPPGKKLIRPSAGFVVKCLISEVNGKPLKKKIFINLVHSDEILKPSSETEKNQAKKWSVPYAIGPVRMEQDKANNLVPTFDICFHPLSLQYAHARKEFCDMVIGIAKSAVVDAYSKSSGEDITIDTNYTILKNVRYKNGAVKTLIVSSSCDQSNALDRVKEDLTVKPNAATDFVVEATDAMTRTSVSGEEAKQHSAKDKADAIIVPKFQIVEQGKLELTTNSSTKSRRPSQLIVHVYLDKVTSAAEIDLDVSKTKVQVGSEEHGYRLDVELPYPINNHKGKASFDTAKKSLILRLPLLPKEDHD